MTREPPTSFLIRLDRPGEGTITSIVTGERVAFATLSDLVRAIERLTNARPGSRHQKEDTA